MKTISFAIPVYRNAGALVPTYEQIRALFEGELRDYTFEIVFVDDGSDDGSFAELLRLRATDPRVRLIRFSRNFGQIAAVIAGFRHAKGDAVICKAADLQEPMDAVLAMVREWEKGAKVVFGQRTGREDSWLATILGDLYWKLLKLANPSLPTGSDFFLLDRQAADAFNAIDESDRFFPVDVLWLGFSPKVVPYKRQRRTIGTSQWGLSRKVKAGIDGILHSTYLPIRIISLMGMLVSLTGFAAAALVVYQRLTSGTPAPGWHSIVCLILVTNGLVLFMLGIVGEYIWRIYNQAKGRAVYLIQETHG